MIEARPHPLFEVLGLALFFRRLEFREVIGLEIEGQVATLRDPGRVLQRPGEIGEKVRHLLRRFEIQLVGSKLEPFGIVDRFAGLDAEQHIMGVHILLVEVVAVVARHERYREPPAHVEQALVDRVLDVDAVVLHFQKKVPLAEEFQVLLSGCVGFFQAVSSDQGRDLAVQTGAEGDQTFVMGFEYLFVDPRFVVKSLQLRRGHHAAQIAVSRYVLGQQDQVRETLVVLGRLVGQAARRDIAFAADDRLDTGFNGFAVEIDGAEHGAVIGEGHRFHAELGDPLQQIGDPNRAVEQAVLGVDVEMDKFGRV